MALTEDGHEGKAYGLSGPEAVSYRDQATRLFTAAGREVEVEEIPVETLKRELVRAGVPPWNAEGLCELFELYASGGAQMVTSGVKDALGPRRRATSTRSRPTTWRRSRHEWRGAPDSRPSRATASWRSSIPTRGSASRASRRSCRASIDERRGTRARRRS